MVESQETPINWIVFEPKLGNLSDYQKKTVSDQIDKAKDLINSNISRGQKLEDNNNYYAWLEIAIRQKSIGDYEHAEKIWLWFNDAYPGNSVSPMNLGDLYKSFLIDKEKSEQYYKLALDREKHDFNIYNGLFELYRYNFNDSALAVAVLKDGLKNNPDDQRYVETLALYLVSIQNSTEASALIEDFIKTHPAAKGLRKILN